MSEPTIFMSAGDDSGDLHASNLMRALSRIKPGVSYAGFGMKRMLGAGLKPLEPEDERGSAMWLHNLLRVGDFYRRLNACRKYFREVSPDVVVLVDYGGFNLYLARAATRQGIPVVYYILPQVWAHGRYRLKKIRKWVTLPIVIYPFEPDLYESYGVQARYVGHPLFDHLAENGPEEAEVHDLRENLGGRPVALFPGSRRQEVSANLPVLLEAAGALRRRFTDLTFGLVCPDTVQPVARELIEARRVEVFLPETDAPTLAAASELCLTKSGTITLEIAALGTPMVICYRVNPLFYFLARGLTDTAHIGLINNLAGREVCPEKAMPRFNPEWVVEKADRLLGDENHYAKCQRDIERVLKGFACPGASERAAHAVAEFL